MPSKTKPKVTKRKDEDKSQRERFIEAARAVGVDTECFEKAISKIVPTKSKQA